MGRFLSCLLLLVTLAGCGQEQSQRILGVWSNGELGRVLDVSPHGFYAEVYLDSEVRVSAWSIPEKGELVLPPLCSSLDPAERTLHFTFEDDGLTFPGSNGRYTRYLKEAGQTVADTRLVGLWRGKTLTHKSEFMEFTPWGTAIWNRWDGKPGSERLVAGWAAVSGAKEGGLRFGSGVEDGTYLGWGQPLSYEVSATKMTLVFPGDIGSKSYVKVSREDLMQATKSPTR